MSFKRPYKTRTKIRRYGYVDGRFRRITIFDWNEFINMGMKLTIYSTPNINGWNEVLKNGYGVTIAYKIINKP